MLKSACICSFAAISLFVSTAVGQEGDGKPELRYPTECSITQDIRFQWGNSLLTGDQLHVEIGRGLANNAWNIGVFPQFRPVSSTNEAEWKYFNVTTKYATSSYASSFKVASWVETGVLKT